MQRVSSSQQGLTNFTIMENDDRINYELFTALCSREPEEELRKRFKEIIATARDLEIEILPGDVERGMEVSHQIQDLDEEDNEPVSCMPYLYVMEVGQIACHDDLQLEESFPVDISRHMHILVDVAMEERNYHDALVVRRFLETFNRKDNHLVEAELPRLDAYIDTLDGYYEYLEQRDRKTLKNGTRVGRKREYLFVTDEASSLKDEETTAEQASLFINRRIIARSLPQYPSTCSVRSDLFLCLNMPLAPPVLVIEALITLPLRPDLGLLRLTVAPIPSR